MALEKRYVFFPVKIFLCEGTFVSLLQFFQYEGTFVSPMNIGANVQIYTPAPFCIIPSIYINLDYLCDDGIGYRFGRLSLFRSIWYEDAVA